jgi:hypothetical protein
MDLVRAICCVDKKLVRLPYISIEDSAPETGDGSVYLLLVRSNHYVTRQQAHSWPRT